MTRRWIYRVFPFNRVGSRRVGSRRDVLAWHELNGFRKLNFLCESRCVGAQPAQLSLMLSTSLGLSKSYENIIFKRLLQGVSLVDGYYELAESNKSL